MKAVDPRIGLHGKVLHDEVYLRVDSWVLVEVKVESQEGGRIGHDGPEMSGASRLFGVLSGCDESVHRLAE